MPASGSRAPIELFVELDRDGATALHHQLERQLRAAIQQGRLEPGSVLPSSRALAAQVGLSRGVVVEAYEQLAAEGYVASKPRGLTRVAQRAAIAGSGEPEGEPASPRFDFRPGRPDTTSFPRSAWLRAARRAWADMPSGRLGYGDGRGVPELRAALAAYLNRVRGTMADPRTLVISSGFAQGLWLTSSVLRRSGARRLAVEDPSHPGSWGLARSAGLELVGVPVDEEGLRVDELERTDADAVLVTPAHQFPTGAVMSRERRTALIDWAQRHGALIIEDDYDAEFRYDREPIGAIQGLAPDRVVYAGSASKTLAPGLRLGWLIMPAALTEAIASAKIAADNGSPALDQLTFADFLEHGELDRHLRRMRLIYRRRRDVLLAGLARHVPALRPVGSAAGLHVLAWLPPGMSEADVLARAAARSILVAGASAHWTCAENGRGGLILGYADMSEALIRSGIEKLASAMADRST